jgi:tetratricopeptide (TPR) repeat protein
VNISETQGSRLHYPNVSAGYLGQFCDQATLNSAFVRAIVSGEQLRARRLFPQRVPVAGFFWELTRVEGTNFAGEFNAMASRSLTRLDALLSHQVSDESVQAELIEIVSLLLRYGRFAELRQRLAPLDAGTTDIQFALRLLAAEAGLAELISVNAPADIAPFHKLAMDVAAGAVKDPELQLRILARYIVVSNRHSADYEQRAIADQCMVPAKALLEALEQHGTFSSRVACSFGARGLAMSTIYGRDMQQQMLERALDNAERAVPEDALDVLVAKENFTVVMQTMAKWHESEGRESDAIGCLQRMVRLDRFDSTGFSELGLHHLRHERQEQALEAFGRARELGPPGLALNTYYHGICLAATGQIEEAERAYLASAQADPDALSPRLALIDLYAETGNGLRSKALAREILESPELAIQLDFGERDSLRGLLP